MKIGETDVKTIPNKIQACTDAEEAPMFSACAFTHRVVSPEISGNFRKKIPEISGNLFLFFRKFILPKIFH